MNILKLIESFTNEGFIKNLNEKSNRRDSFNQFGKVGANAAMAALPLGMAALFSQKANAANSAYATTSADSATSALQLALILEYLEDEFYATALDTAGLIPAADQAIIAQISQHEAAHVNFLMSALGANAPAKPTFDFTVGGAFDTFSNYETFLALSQAFEDTGVRAYKGQAGNLMGNGDLLTAALQIHSVEARHASQIRRLRGLKGWITGNTRGAGMPEQTQGVYDGEENTTHGGVNITMYTATAGNPAFGSGSYTESFDEPMTGETATSIASLFIVS
ncbi:ferritin-like domain-containing protein [Flavobacterium sp. RHBU_3]|uniref:ferritin-like domain-containing protein n=1 Tax=Flavobacterium sp. RHBU_3 TaxID=3391184 RepID=UPI00398518E8